MKTCSDPECDRTIEKNGARGLCSMHWKRKYGKRKVIDVACPTCGSVTQKRDDGPNSTRRFCSLTCRDVWRIETDNNPSPSSPGRQRTRSVLPDDHPVRVLMRENAARRTPLRVAFEAQDWTQVLSIIESTVVKVDECWLWSGKYDRSGYGRLAIGKRHLMSHRLAAMAYRRGEIDARMPVHHICAERLCCNPKHLQVVTPAENTAEMLERGYYISRIKTLEQALLEAAPNHPALSSGISPAA